MQFAFDFGEKKIIQLIKECLEEMPEMPLPFGDDASAVSLGNGRVAVIKCDTLVEKTDVPPGMSYFQVGRKSIVVNISDLAAKGAKPVVALTSIAFPPYLSIDEITNIAKGINAGAKEYGAYVIGGDLSESSDLMITCFLFGISSSAKLMKRSGAKPGDVVVVTGEFGDVAAGLKILLEGAKSPEELRKKLLHKVYMPVARLKEGLALSETGVVTSSIDSSDGLVMSLYEISRMSKVGFIIDNIPVSEEAKKFAELNNVDPKELALYGGEEYELILTIDQRYSELAKEAVKRVGGKLIQIGHVIEEQGVFLKVNRDLIKLEERGFEHFRKTSGPDGI